MSINPVEKFGSTDRAQSDSQDARTRSVQAPAPASAGPDSGTSPKQQALNANIAVSSAEMPQDEVQVQRDSATNGDIVIKYVDQHGDLVLQIPSSQVLGVARAIDQELEQEAKARASSGARTATDGGKVHGH